MISLPLDPSRPALLLTGATGLLGSCWLPLLQTRYSDHQIVLLVRNETSTARLSPTGIRTLIGDLTEPDLGLSPSTYLLLSRALQQIVHCAADIRFSVSLGQSRATNLEGTRRLLNLARQSRSFKKFAHLSTVYVVGDRAGECNEEPATPGCFLSAYQQSKFEAEQLVLDAAPDVPSAIYRLSTVIGDSVTGHVRQFNYFHQLLRLALTNRLPFVPAHENASIDLITSDWAVSVLDQLFAEHFAPGQILHICAGSHESLTARQLVEFTFDFFDQHPATASSKRGQRPKPVDLSEFLRYAGRFLSTGTPQRFWRSLGQFLPHLGIPQSFRNGKSAALLAGRNLAPPPIGESLSKVISYCIQSNWGYESARRS
jgi:thioester reductase-like protein